MFINDIWRLNFFSYNSTSYIFYKDEEPHVKKTMKNKREKIELITRVDLVSFTIRGIKT